MTAQAPARAHPLGSLRVRLAGAMLLVLVAALGLSSAADEFSVAAFSHAHGWLRVLDSEPYQDGVVLGSFGLVVGGLIWLVSAWSLAPLSRASREAREAGPGHPGARISTVRLPTEIQPLVDAVNGALDRLEAAYAAERQFTAHAAHELRTPLAVLTLRLQQARTEGRSLDWPGVERDLDQMTRLVTQLLDLARKQSGHAGQDMRPVNLSRIAREAAAAILPLAEAAGRDLVVELPAAMAVRGRDGDLRDMVTNVLENALVHGQGAIRLCGAVQAGRAALRVTDEGAGVAEAMREALFERFRKAQAGSPGTGLGLAIVREVARSHGGSAAFEPGPGCVVRVEVPLAEV